MCNIVSQREYSCASEIKVSRVARTGGSLKHIVRAALLLSSVSVPLFAGRAAEVTAYSYDALGRLVGTVVSGSINAGLQTGTTFDAAGNRTSYSVSGAAAPIPPSFSVSNATATEGGTLTFTVTRSGVLSAVASVTYATSNGSAIASSDYTAGSGVLNFAVGETSKTIVINTIDDAAAESVETMTLALSNPNGATLGSPSVGTGTINDNDVAAVSFAIANAKSVVEGNVATFTVTRTGSTSAAYTMSYTTGSRTALAGSDFTTTAGILSFSAGQATKTITVSTINDTVHEETEIFSLTLSAPSGGATLTRDTAFGTITDDDTSLYYINDAYSVSEGRTAVFNVLRTNLTATAEMINFTTVSGTALAGSDFVAQSGTLNFPAGATGGQISIATIADAVTEPTENFTVVISGASNGGQIQDNTGSGAITAPGTAGTTTAFNNLSDGTGGGHCVYNTTCASMLDFGGDFAGQKFVLSQATVLAGGGVTNYTPSASSNQIYAVNWRIFAADGAGGLPGTLLASGVRSDTTSVTLLQSNVAGGYNLSLTRFNLPSISLAAGNYYFVVQAVTDQLAVYLSSGLAPNGAVQTRNDGSSWTTGYQGYSSVAVSLYRAGP